MSFGTSNTNTELIDEQKVKKQENQKEKLKSAKFFLSSVLAISGSIILLSQLAPIGISLLSAKVRENSNNNIKDPATSQEMAPAKNELPYYDPGISYFQNIIQHVSPDYNPEIASAANNANSQIYIDEDYSDTMYLSIPSIGINNVPITPNVDSYDEKVYDNALKKGLAHFKGTVIPGDGGGNSFIYGHSAVDSWFQANQNNVETVFSKLENTEIADTVTITKNGEDLEYVIQKIKVIDPKDFEVIIGTPGKETITLMTCTPNGIGTQRLIVIAERV
ncbi:sortase [Candidatus Dojkabacteria bacterium]|nr:sortase [Candidatus Dojkabacteria bacterium]